MPRATQVVRLALILVVGLLAFGIVSMADCTCVNDDCYEDVVVSGAGDGVSNGLYHFTSMVGSKPRYVAANLYDIFYGLGDWYITDSGAVRYGNLADGSTPPTNDWKVVGGAPPAPTLSGGRLCLPPRISGSPAPALTASTYTFNPKVRDGHGPFAFTIANQPPWADFDPATGQLSGTPRYDDLGVYSRIIVTVTDAHGRSDTLGPFSIEVESAFLLVPLGAGGSLLDRATETATNGQTVLQSLQVLDENGNPSCGSPLHVCVYAVDYTTTPPARTLIDYRFASCNAATGLYQYEVPSYAMASPLYDVVLSFADEPNLTRPLVPSGSGLGPSPEEQSAPTIYEVGEAITGKCQILGANGLPTVTSFIHAFLYSVDARTRPETLALVDHWIIRCSSGTSIYHLNIDTTDLAPGEYRLSLNLEDGTVQSLPIKVEVPT